MTLPNTDIIARDAKGNLWAMTGEGATGLLQLQFFQPASAKTPSTSGGKAPGITGGFRQFAGHQLGVDAGGYDRSKALLIRFKVVFATRGHASVAERINVRHIPATIELPASPAHTAAAVIMATKTVSPAGTANLGDTLMYTVTITNTGDATATGVTFTDTIDPNTTLVGGSVNSQPIANLDTYTASGNIPISIAAPGVLTNDIDPDTGNNTGLTVTQVQGSGANVGVSTATTATGIGGVTGFVTLNANGSFTYEPPPGFTGANDTFTYQISDAGGKTDTTTVTITISQMVWFINNSGGGLNRGTFTNPFTTIASFNTANTGAAPNPQPGHFIALRRGTGTYTEADGVNLRDTQKLIGEAVQFNTVFTADANSSSAYNTFAGGTMTAPSIVTTAGNGVDLASGNTARGFNVGDTPGFFGFNGGAVGSPTINTVSVTGTGGAINVSTSGAFGSVVTFSTLESTSSPGANINLVSVTGTLGVTSGGTGLSGSAASSNAVNISGGTVSMTYPGNLTKSNSGALVSISGGHTTGTITFSGTLNASAGTGLQFDNADSTTSYNFTGTTTLNGGDAGIDILNGSAGTFSFGSNTSITSPTGTAFNVSGGSPTVTYSGNITQNNAARVVDIQGTTANTIIFSTGTITGGASSTGVHIGDTTAVNGNVSFANLNLGTSMARITNQAVTITNGTGTYSLGAVSIFTSGVQGIVATDADGTINSASGTVDATNARAINIDGPAGLTTLGMTLTRVSSTSSTTNGISIQDTNGSFTITGTGTAGSGGTIQDTTGRGGSFISASNITLKYMNFTNAGTTDLDADNSGLSTGDNLATNAAIHLQSVTTVTLDNLNLTGTMAEQGINGNTVSAFTLSNSSITNAGNGADEDNIHFYNMSGTSAITNTTLTHTSGGGDDNLNLQTQAGTLNLTISGGSATGTGGGVNQLGSGYLFGIRGTSNATITLSSANSSNNFSGGIVADAFDTATMDLTVSNSTSSGNNDQLSVSAGDSSNVDLNITGNTLSSVATGDFVVVSLLGSAFDTGYVFDAIITSTILPSQTDSRLMEYSSTMPAAGI